MGVLVFFFFDRAGVLTLGYDFDRNMLGTIALKFVPSTKILCSINILKVISDVISIC